MKTARLIRFQEALGNKDVNLYSDLLTRHTGAQLADRITKALRVSLGGIHHRVLSFFRGAMAANGLSRACERERVVPSKEIAHAVERRSGLRRIRRSALTCNTSRSFPPRSQDLFQRNSQNYVH